MSNDNKIVKDLTEEFDEAITKVKTLKGGVKGFVLLAVAAEKDDENLGAFCAISGSGDDLMSLISHASTKVIENFVLKAILSGK